MILPMEGDAARGWTPGTPTVFLSTPANEVAPMFSPDGRWIAYVSNEAGSTYDVYVRPFPGPGGQMARLHGRRHLSPVVGHDARAAVPDPAQGKIMAAPYAVVGDSFRADTPQIWSPTSVQGASTDQSAYDLHPDGKRVAAAAARTRAASSRTRSCSSSTSPTTCARSRRGPSNASGRARLRSVRLQPDLSAALRPATATRYARR